MRPANGRPYPDDLDSDLQDMAAWETEPSGTLNLSMTVNRELVNLTKPHVFVIRSKDGANSSGAEDAEVAKRPLGAAAAGPPRKTGFSIEEIMRK